jgi:hypothetical protein
MNVNDVCNLVSALCDGDENAYHTLIEANDDIVPALIEQFASAGNGERRAKIVEVIWQHRHPTTVSFLASTLSDPHPDVWKQALDGLVTIGGTQSLNALNDHLDRIPQDDGRFAWIIEAIDQIKSQTR